MAKSILLASSSPATAADDEEFGRWYDGVHIPDVRAAIPAITTVGRYKVLTADADALPRYVAIYEIDDADAAGAAAALQGAVGEGRVTMTETMNVTDHPPVVEFLTSI
ncbi:MULTISPECIES: DUF4286 family protein [Bacteria]|uniref:DUF4286 family protein n=1 Tax=Bacteria TaxID=2 RepID=UPI00050C090F|nr:MULTISPECIES: DUF4286 family protein [Bacteria]KJV03541.1 hypothetical protein VF34_01531 [Rhodococcus sp. PML026]TAJ35263.1 MAG: hypothetical protein EPO55_25885 [Reyranella sp.]